MKRSKRDGPLIIAVDWLLRSDIWPVMRLAIPLRIAQVATIALGLIDTLTFSAMGTDVLAAGGLGVAIFTLINIISVGVISAVGNQIAWAKGAGCNQEFRPIVIGGIIASILTGTFAALLLIACSPLLVDLGQDATIVGRTRGFLFWAGLGIVPNLIFTVFRGLCVGLSNPRPVTIITILSVGLKAVLNWAIIMLPALHVDSMAWVGGTTALTFLFMAFALGTYCRKRYQAHVGFPERDAIPWHNIQECFLLGLPIGAAYGIEAGFFAVAAIIAGTINEVSLAAHHVANQFVYMTFMIAVGISHATSVRIGQAAGTKDLLAVRMVAVSGLTLGFVTMSFMALVFFFFGSDLVSLIVSSNTESETHVVYLATHLLLIAACFQWSDGLQNIAMGALRGLKNTKSTMYAAVVGYWVVGLPCAFIWRQNAREEIYGVWWGLAAGLSVTALILIWHLHLLTQNSVQDVISTNTRRKRNDSAHETATAS